MSQEDAKELAMPCRLSTAALLLSVLGGSAPAETYVGQITGLTDSKLTILTRSKGGEEKQLALADKLVVVKTDRKGKERPLSLPALKWAVAAEKGRGVVIAKVSTDGGKVVRVELRGESMAEEAQAILAKADRIELYSLEPEPSREQAKAAGATFIGGFLVLGKTEIKDKEPLRRVREGLEGSVGMGGKMAKCFDPRHAIRATAGKKAVRVVICFRCGQAHVYSNGDDGPSKTVPITKGMQADLDKILTAAKVPLAKEAKE